MGGIFITTQSELPLRINNEIFDLKSVLDQCGIQPKSHKMNLRVGKNYQLSEAPMLREQLQHLLTNAPTLAYENERTEDDIRWLAKAEALLSKVGNVTDVLDFRNAAARLDTYSHDRLAVIQPVMTAYYRVELDCPQELQGKFIPQGDEWGGFAALVKLLSQPCKNAFVIDPYLDANSYCEVVGATKANNVQLLTSTHYRDGLNAAHRRRIASHPVGTELRYAQRGALHDRLIILDEAEVWLVSQSLKDIAKRSPASLLKADAELSRWKVEAYSNFWNDATAWDQQ